MIRKRRKKSSHRSSGEFGDISPSVGTEFYAAGPTEKPLYETKASVGGKRELKTSRHQASTGRREETSDPRERAALMAILKSGIMLVLIVVAFLLLWKGISLHEEKIRLEHLAKLELSPVMTELVLEEGFDIQSEDAREKFADRVERWKEADRLVRSADALLQRNIYEEAIDRCQEALRLDPSHMGALDRLGILYFEKEAFVESVNAYIRLLSVDPSRMDVQKRLIQALDAFGDAAAVMYMAEWYLESHPYDTDIQHYLANAHYVGGDFAEAAEQYGRVLRDTPKNVAVLERQASAYLQIEQYEKALAVFAELQSTGQKQEYYKQMAICHAQLLRCEESVTALARAAQLYEDRLVVNWVQDPRFDPIRTDRAFQRFLDRVAGEETRLLIEKMAIEQAKKPDTNPKLAIPEDELPIDNELLKPRQ